MMPSGLDPIQYYNADAIAMHPCGKGTNVALPLGGLCNCPPTAYVGICLIDMAASALENWIGLAL